MKLSLLKLFDVSIIPAILAVFFKFFGLFAALSFLNLDWVSGFQNYVPTLVVNYNSIDEQIIVNTISIIFMSLILIVGCAWLLIQAHHFHDTHVHPRRAAKLERQGLGSLITSSHEIFHRLFIWVSLLWFLTFLTFYEVYLGNAYLWVGFGLLGVSILVTHALTLDVAKEWVSD